MPRISPGLLIPQPYPAPEGYHWTFPVVDTIVHDPIPAVTHEEPAIPAIPAVTRIDPVVDENGNPVYVKKFSIEERRGFSMDILDILGDKTGVGPPIKSLKIATDIALHPWEALKSVLKG